jgi:hypothetical protein
LAIWLVQALVVRCFSGPELEAGRSSTDWAVLGLFLAMKTDGNGRKNPISTSVSIFFGGNGIGFGKYGFKNGIGICRHTETNKYGWRAGKLN